MLLSVVAASALMYSERQQVPILGVLCACFSLFVLCYVDCWIFDCTEKTIEYRRGVLCILLHTRYAFSDVETTETERFTKGVLKTTFIRCVLCLHSGEKKIVAIFPEHNKKRMSQWERIAALWQRT